jgi:hypothetical protein
MSDPGPDLSCSSGLTLEFRSELAKDSIGMPSYITTLMSSSLRETWLLVDPLLDSALMLARSKYNKDD